MDDSAGNRRILRRMLQQLGCTVVEASDGDEVIGALARATEETGRAVDIVLTDIEMARVSGSTAVVAARRAGWTLPIVAVTGNAIAEDVAIRACAACREAQLCGVLVFDLI